MLKNNQNLTEVLNRNYSNSEFEGFCVDLLDEISRVLKFRYKIKPITTGRYDDMVEEVKNKVRKTRNKWTQIILLLFLRLLI
jgi:hypothetical protein